MAPIASIACSLLLAAHTAAAFATGSYSTTFAAADRSDWDFETDCAHCDNHGGDECTQNRQEAIEFGAVQGGTGARISTKRLSTKSSCGGACESGHMTWKQEFTYGTIKVRSRWFPGHSADVSSGSGFIGLFGSGAGSITFIFHGKGWEDGSSADFTNTFQSEVYRTDQGKNKINTKLDAAGALDTREFHDFELQWMPDRVKWHVDGVLRRTWESAENIPNKPMHLRLHQRSGFCSQMPAQATLLGEFLSFSYTPLAGLNTSVV